MFAMLPGMSDLFDQLNNREEALAVWAVIFLAWMLTQAEIRGSLARRARAFFAGKLPMIVMTAALYSSGVVIVLRQSGIWEPAHLKATIVWFVGTALLMVFGHGQPFTQGFVVQLMIKAIGLAVFLSFFVNLYVFPFIVELVFVPFMIILVTMIVVTDAFKATNPEYENARRILNRLLMLIGYGLLAFAVERTISDANSVFSVQTVQDFFVPPLLTILFAPFVYAFALYAGYKQLFMRTTLALRDNPRLGRRAKWAFLRACGLRLTKLTKFSQYASRRIWTVEDANGLDRLLDRADRFVRRSAPAGNRA